MKKTIVLLLPLIMLVSSVSWSQEHPATAPTMEKMDTQPHPVLSENGSWTGIMIIIVLGMFLAAAVIGPVVRVLSPPEVPPAHSHDEPPGTSGHHGASGTVDHEDPEHEGGAGHGHGGHGH